MTANTTLQLGADSSTLLCTDESGAVVQYPMPLGYASLARQRLRHTPPTPLEIEHAIEHTEDVVMPLAAKVLGTVEFAVRGVGAALFLQAVGAAPNATLRWSLDEVEDLFNRIVMVSEGRPSAQEALPTTPEFYAAMVILRESLHHLRFSGVVLLA